MAYVSKQDLAQMDRPDFLVDVVMRANGTLHMVLEGMDWEDAVLRAQSALEDGLQVEIEESDAWAGADEQFIDEFDRQQ